MATQVQITDDIAVSGVSAQGTARSSDAVKASLDRLLQLLELLLDGRVEGSTTQTARTKDQVVGDVLHRLGPLLSEYMAQDPAQAETLMSSVSSLLNEYANGSQEAMERVLTTLKPVIIKYLAEHPGQEETVLRVFAPLVREAGGDVLVANLIQAYRGVMQLAVALRGPDAARASAEIHATFQQLHAHAHSTSSNDNAPDSNTLMGFAMYFVQLFQQEISKSQANQDQLQIGIGKTMMEAAQKALDDVNEQIRKAAEAASGGLFGLGGIFGQVIMAVVGAVLAFMTCGIAAGIVAVMMGAFMASPLFNMMVQKITEDIAGGNFDTLYNKYKSEGKSDEEARNLATEKLAAAGIIAKIIGIAVVCIATVLADQAALTALESNAIRTAEAATAGAESGVRSSSTSLVVANGLTATAASNIWMDIFTAAKGAEWVKKHQLAVILADVFCELVTSMFAAYNMKGVYDGRKVLGLTNRIDALAEKAGYIMLASNYLQSGNMLVQGSMNAVRAKYLSDLASYQDEIGKLQKLLQINIATSQLNQFTTKTNDDAASTITKTVAEEMAMLSRNAGLMWDTTDRALRA